MSAVSGQLTGRTRHRVDMFGKLVMQVELWDTRQRMDEEEWYTRWRDARVEDLTVVKAEEKGC